MVNGKMESPMEKEKCIIKTELTLKGNSRMVKLNVVMDYLYIKMQKHIIGVASRIMQLMERENWFI
jgi:hypothetical protein